MIACPHKSNNFFSNGAIELGEIKAPPMDFALFHVV